MVGKKTHVRNAVLSAVSALALILGAGAASADEAETVNFDIEAQPLAQALLEFSRQSKVNVIAPASLTRELGGVEVSGEMTPEDALQKILGLTALDIRERNGGYLLVRATTQIDGSDRTPVAGEVDSEIAVDTIVVIGTNIRGIYPEASPLTVIDRIEIDTAGFSTAQELIRSLPQNFTGFVSETAPLVGFAESSSQFNSSINLRGLGVDATLTLLNGRRIAPSNGGASVDISTIPLSALERVEMLTDGASAIYGSDAVAGVVNFVLRDDFDGAETSAQYGTVTDGGLNEMRVSQTFGKAWNSGNFMLAYEYLNQDNLGASDRDFASGCDLSPLGGGNFCPDPAGFTSGNGTSPGTIVGGAGAFTIPTGQDGSSLGFSDLIPGSSAIPNDRALSDVIPAIERHSVVGTLRQDLGSHVELMLDGGYSNRETDAAFVIESETLSVPVSNAFLSQELADGVAGVPGATSVFVNYSFINEFGVDRNLSEVESYFINSTIKADLNNDFQAEMFTGYADQSETSRSPILRRSDLAAALASNVRSTAFNPFGDGVSTNASVLETIRETSRIGFGTDILTLGGKLDGPVFSLPGGEVRIAFGGEYRDESFDSVTDLIFQGQVTNTGGGRSSREIAAFFGEVFVPVIGAANAIPGVVRFDVSAGIRIEDYSDFGSTTNPKVGVVWTPFDGLDIRGTYGTSFQAPTLAELDETRNGFVVFNFIDPTSPTLFSVQAILTGGNAALNPEEATTWTAGFDFQSDVIPGLKIGATYFNVDFKDRIVAVDFRRPLSEPDVFGSLATRRPTDPSELSAFEARIAESLLIEGAVDLSFGAPVDVFIDARSTNLARTEVAGVDFSGSYSLETSIGELTAGVNASWLTKFERQPSPVAPPVDDLDTILNPNDLRLRGSVGWLNGPLSGTLFVNHTTGYTDDQLGSAASVKVDPWTTMDLSVRVDLGDYFSSSVFNESAFQISVQNLFDEDPPFVTLIGGNGAFGYDPTQASARGRFIALRLVKKF